jgi:Bacterial Ig-like domain (group 3)/FG-GAP-like repeat
MTANSWCKTPSGARSLLAFLIAPLLSLPLFALSQTPIFPVPVTAPAVVGTQGDFNGDGQIDQASITSDSSITVYLNEGANNPATPVVTSGITCAPSVLVAADMNKDNKLDLVVTCAGSQGYVAVLLGNGDGTFMTPAYYAVAGAYSLATPVDLNGDGYPDVTVFSTITSNGSVNAAVMVLLNQGASSPGALSTPKSYSLAHPLVTQIGFGDFNGDGKPDILAGSPTEVFYGNGGGTFQAGVTTTATTFYATGDFNHDGLTDIAYITLPTAPVTGTESLHVLLGSSNGQFTAGSTLTLPPLESYGTILPFFATSSSTTLNLALIGQSTRIVLNDGAGNFTAGPSYGVGADGGVQIASASIQTGTNGNTNLALYQQTLNKNLIVLGNGDGTFQAPPGTSLPSAFSVPMIPVTADLNGDGLTDVLAVDFGGNLIAALGRGDGKFIITTQNTGSTQPQGTVLQSPIVASGDFNGDAKLDALVILPGSNTLASGSVQNAQYLLYTGNGDGTFSSNPVSHSLGIYGAGLPLIGDFNGDGKLDFIVPYVGLGGTDNDHIFESGVLFLAGTGNGNFAAPVAVSLPASITSPPNLGVTADVNGDGKLDIVGQNTVSLGNGDGTFTQQPLGISGTLLAIRDLNGDGKPDLVMVNNANVGIYAGNGDGTFQQSPFFSGPIPNYDFVISPPPIASIGDVNADGNSDLILQYAASSTTSQLLIYLGNGSGNFTADQNIYYPIRPDNTFGTLGRLNNQAPPLSSDNKLDFLYYSISGGAISYLNQLNPSPATSAPLPSKTVLTASAASTTPGQQLTLTATVSGIGPTGNVTFVTGTTNLGTAPVTNGTATLATSFATVSTFPITANYPGDANNTASSSSAVSVVVAVATSTTTLTVSAGNAGTNQQLTFTASVSGLNPTGKVTFATATSTLGTSSITNGVATLPFTFTTVGSYAVTASYAGDVDNSSSTSTAVTVVVAVPDYKISASPSSATISPGQSATTTLTVTPVGGYSGTVKFSCGTLPSGATCTFAPASVTPTSGAATSVLTITTTAPSTARLRDRSIPLQAIAWASLILLTLSPRKLRGLNRRLARATLLPLLLAAGLLSFSGCSSSSPSNNTPTNPGTPAGAQTITLTAADSSGSLSHAINFQVTVQ